MKLTNGFFGTMYMSLDACKRGFMAGCRPLICIDGAHIKTKFGGQLLTAVGVDPNDCIYPIAMAVVEVEDTSTWKWFLNTLKEDLGIENTSSWTIMSDRQKGLINAVNALFPEAEHRFCVRHLYQNFNKKFKGENLKNRLWAIARSYNVLNWRKNMDLMKELNQEAYDYLEAIDPKSWCRAFFKHLPRSDLLLNNTCEVFNK
jgi:transposase-like protein